MTRLPTSLRVALYTFLYETPGVGDFTDHNGDALPFDLTAFLAEALLSADDNDLASERAGHHDFPGLTCMLERLDEHLDYHSTASEVRQAKGGAVLQWFDAP